MRPAGGAAGCCNSATPGQRAGSRTPPEYRGEWRCDTTPRYSRDGRKVIFDSPHGGNGRQMYLADIGSIIDSA